MGMFDVTFEMSGILYETTYDIDTIVKFLHENYRCCFNSELLCEVIYGKSLFVIHVYFLLLLFYGISWFLLSCFCYFLYY